MEQRHYYVQKSQAPSFFARFFANALALGLSAFIISGVRIDGVSSLLLSAAIFTLLNAIVKPILVLLTLPLTIISLGLFYPIVNVIIINILGVIMGSKFNVDGFFSAIVVSIIVAMVNYAVTHVFKEDSNIIVTK